MGRGGKGMRVGGRGGAEVGGEEGGSVHEGAVRE